MILSTTIAESSLTIKEVDCVVDFCLVRFPVFNAVTQLEAICTVWASQASCTQRKGRTGRVGPGTVIRMVPKASFPLLRPFTLPEILNGDLESVVLFIKQSSAFGAGVAVEEVTSRLVDAPDVESVRATKARLVSLGVLSADESLTRLGAPARGGASLLSVHAAPQADVDLMALLRRISTSACKQAASWLRPTSRHQSRACCCWR